jgi:glycosyltransferase involved in cell wall biosynthesis
MHVAYIHQHFVTRSGTAGTRSYEMARRLIAAGHRVTMICGESAVARLEFKTNERVAAFTVDNIRVLCVREPYASQMVAARRALAFGRFARAAQRLVAGLDADLVFATSTPLTVGLPGMKGARRLGVPFVFEVRDLWPELLIAVGAVRNPLLKWYLERMERRIYRAADRIYALAPGIRDGICRTGYPLERVLLIPNCCDLDLFRPDARGPLDAKFGAPDEFRLVYAGAHGTFNGLDAILDAVAELQRRAVSGVRFVFIGAGREKPRLMARCAREGLQPYVSWIEPMPKEELARVIASMDVGLMTLANRPEYYYGTSPNKFFDYIAAGIPVLNNYPGWLADMIREHRIGEVVPPDDPVAFADAVLRLRDERQQRPEVGRRARALAEAQFSRDRLGQQFVAGLELTLAEWATRRRPTRP